MKKLLLTALLASTAFATQAKDITFQWNQATHRLN